MNCQIYSPVTLPPEEISRGIHWAGGCVGSRIGLETVEKRICLTPVQDLTSSLQS